MAFVMMLFPLIMAIVAAAVPSNRYRPLLLPFTALIYLVMTGFVLAKPELSITSRWLLIDPPSKIVLLLVSTLFLFCSFYTVPYLALRKELSNRLFTTSLLSFLSAFTVVVWVQHLGLMWVAIEATTLVTAPLIYFNQTRLSLEAMWKYLLIGSVGIAMALLGTFFMAYSSLYAGLTATLHYGNLVEQAPHLSKVWLHMAFILLLVGYGTKMGLAPMHTWKPDAYGEAPGVVGAIFAGGTTSCAFLIFIRIYHICFAAGEHAYMQKMLLFIGFLSMLTAALFMIRQKDLKRMLAYSSVEHMGILMIGLGIGIPALFGTLLHVITNGLTKGILFLSVANIHRAYGSKQSDKVHGAIRLLPLSGTLFLVGFLAITGSPPFAPFISEFSILTGAFEAKMYGTGALFLILLLIVFIGMGATVLSAVQGSVPPEVREKGTIRDHFSTGAPIVGLTALILLLGVYLPAPLRTLLSEAVVFLGGQP